MQDINSSYTYDPQKKLNDLFFIVLAYAAEEVKPIVISETFGCCPRWAEDTLSDIRKFLNVKTTTGAVQKAWRLGMFTDAAFVPNIPWRTQKFEYREKKFYVKT